MKQTGENLQTISAFIAPRGSLEVLSQTEVNKLLDTSQGGLYDLYRCCSLAVLNCGSHVDDAAIVMEQNKHFQIRILQQERGIELNVINAPAHAFVDGEMIEGIKEQLFSVLRDIIFSNLEIKDSQRFNLTTSADTTNAVFHILRNARSVSANRTSGLVVCWGGHAIGRVEYDYSKQVGYELGLRRLNVCTGCGPGAMKGPMKGAAIAHAKQRIRGGRYIGITEPGIIAAESPNPIVNELIIMPDIEKRLEAFVRLGHGIIVFPGGVGTAEEILYLLGILLHPDNSEIPFPLIFTGPASAADYFRQIDAFIGSTLGEAAQQLYQVIIDDEITVAQTMKQGVQQVTAFRKANHDANYFNWLLTIEPSLQKPFEPSHENMAQLQLYRDQPAHQLAAHLRRAFSGIVAGNVKENGMRIIRQQGPYELSGDPEIMQPLDTLLRSFVSENRMKLSGREYVPCYKIKR